MKSLHITNACLCFLLAFSNLGCAQNNSLQKEYGSASSYFIGLNALKEKNTNLAIRSLKDASKKASPLISRKAMEKLTELGSIQERTKNCIQLYKTFPDEDSLLIYTKELFAQKEYYTIIAKTDSIDCKKSNNELIYYRLISLLKKNDARLKKETTTWLTEKAYSSWHNKFYTELKKTDTTYINSLVTFRDLVYTKNFTAATQKINSVLETPAHRKPIIFSDIGKSLLYGTKDFEATATFMNSLCKTCPEDCKFYCNFYTGRFYEKKGKTEKAIEKFYDAMEQAKNDALYDNALWYVLNTSLNKSPVESYKTLEKDINKIKDKNYYNDFFDTLSLRLITTQQWELYKKFSDLIWNKASSEVCSKFSYITARLIQTGYIKDVTKEQLYEYFKKSLTSGGDLYYKILSIEKLNLSEDEIKEEFKNIGNKKTIYIDLEKEKLLYGYADFGLAEEIYDEYQKLKDNISSECAKKISQFLWQCGANNEKYLIQSIRIASQKVFNSEKDIDTQLLKLAFPQNYNQIIHETCEKFSQKEYLLYALIRSESFFNSSVISNAGAVGLTQLMESTAKDIARKLKIKEYDLTSPDINILFGSFYFEELTRRLNNSIILAIFSYNGGISRVRSWVKNSSMEFESKNVPNDLFLESLPFAETREYGRKVLSAAVMYGWLYYDTSVTDIAKEILK